MSIKIGRGGSKTMQTTTRGTTGHDYQEEPHTQRTKERKNGVKRVNKGRSSDEVEVGETKRSSRAQTGKACLWLGILIEASVAARGSRVIGWCPILCS